MADYAFKFKAQQAWRRDPYYVASNQSVTEITVVASTEDEARDEARRALGDLDRSWYWRLWLKSAHDVRLVNALEGSEKNDE